MGHVLNHTLVPAAYNAQILFPLQVWCSCLSEISPASYRSKARLLAARALGRSFLAWSGVISLMTYRQE